VPGIEFITTEINRFGSEQRRFDLVPLIRDVGGNKVFAGDFTREDLAFVDEKLRGLQDAKTSGVLSNLSSRLDEINPNR
jgi:hypothetical protein